MNYSIIMEVKNVMQLIYVIFVFDTARRRRTLTFCVCDIKSMLKCDNSGILVDIFFIVTRHQQVIAVYPHSHTYIHTFSLPTCLVKLKANLQWVVSKNKHPSSLSLFYTNVLQGVTIKPRHFVKGGKCYQMFCHQIKLISMSFRFLTKKKNHI